MNQYGPLDFIISSIREFLQIGGSYSNSLRMRDPVIWDPY